MNAATVIGYAHEGDLACVECAKENDLPDHSPVFGDQGWDTDAGLPFTCGICREALGGDYETTYNVYEIAHGGLEAEESFYVGDLDRAIKRYEEMRDEAIASLRSLDYAPDHGDGVFLYNNDSGHMVEQHIFE